VRFLAACALLALSLLASGCRPDSAGESAAHAGGATGGAGLVILPEDAPRAYFHEFGERLWGEQIEHVYLLENREGRTVVVHDLLPDCGCTRPRAAVLLADGTRVEGGFETRGLDLPVPGGATLEVRIGIDTTRVEKPNQHKLAQVRLRCDSDVTPYLSFELHVMVRRAFHAAPPEAVLKSVPQSAGKSVRVDITTEIAGDTARIRAIESTEGPFQAELTESQVGSEPVWILIVRADPGLELGPHAGKVVLSTLRADGTGDGQHFSVPVSAQVVEDCAVEPRVIAIPREEGGVANAVLEALIPGAVVLVRGVKIEGTGSDSLRAEFTAVDPDDEGRAARWRIQVRPTSALPATALSGNLVIDLDAPGLPEVRVPYAARPR
jgi:hypothetical protein